MENKVNQEKESIKKRAKQQITVPFIWEERPGAPKKDWKPPNPNPNPINTAPLPVKYIASVPFKWEEKPGTPLQCFTQEATELKYQKKPEAEIKSLPLPPAFFAKYPDDSDDESSYGDDDDDYYGDPDWLSELDFEAISYQTEDSLQNPLLKQQNGGCYKDMPGSPESSGGSPMRNVSLRGATFLEYMFPLYHPRNGVVDGGGGGGGKCGEEGVRVPRGGGAPPVLVEEDKKVGGDHDKWNGVIRRPLTLGELIMQSRRRSCRRKGVHMMKKQHQPMDFTNNKAHGCFNFGDKGRPVAKLFGKDLLALKLA